MTEWAEALDVYEASLRHHEALIDVEVVDGDNPWPPADLPVGPVPAELADRAAALLVRSNHVVDAMAAKMAGMPQRKPNRYAHHNVRELPRWTKTL